MKNLRKWLAILCALTLLTGWVSLAAFAEEEPATPTDLEPEEQGESVEVIIAATLVPGDSWNGILHRKAPTLLKLDITQAQHIYIVAEGKEIWAGVLKAGEELEKLVKQQTDPETGRVVLDLDARPGSYLIYLGPNEGSLMAKAEVRVLDQEAYELLEAGQIDETGSEPEEASETEDENEPKSVSEEEPEEETEAEPAPEGEEEPAEEPEPEGEKEPAEESEEEPEGEPEETEPDPETDPEEQGEHRGIPKGKRSISVEVTWDVPDPIIGDTAHFKATLKGYDGLVYSMQWQYSEDHKTWIDIPGETTETMDVVVTNENNLVYWRFVVYLEERGD